MKRQVALSLVNRILAETRKNVTEMADARKFSSGWTKRADAAGMVSRLRYGSETYDFTDPKGEKIVLVSKGPLRSDKLAAGQLVVASYNDYNQGAEAYEILGFTDDPNKEDTVKYKTAKELYAAHGVRSLKELEAKQSADRKNIDSRLIVKDIQDGTSGGWFYLFEGAWARGSGAERLSFILVAKQGSEAPAEEKPVESPASA